MKTYPLGSMSLVVVVLTITTPALAQSRPDRPPSDRPASVNEDRPDQRREFQPGPRPEGRMVERVLNQDQRESMRESMQANREEIRALQEKIREARQALIQAALGEEFTESAVRARATEVARLEAEIAVIRLKALSEVEPPLSRDQLEQILNPAPPQGERMQPGNRPQFRGGNQLPPRRLDDEDMPRPRRRPNE